MQEIKLQGCTQRMRWEWEDVQAKLFDVNISLLKLKQNQTAGSVFINETKNIIITFLAAYSVIAGSLSLGMMLAIQYIIGQLSIPIEQIAQFIYSIQDTKISMERISDIREKQDENTNRPINKIADSIVDISIKNLSFAYAAQIANLDDFVNKLPLKYNTVIGQNGRGLSQGQKQRILIARAIYKMPQYLFLDEATNALDASNEKQITDNLSNFMKKCTVFIVAHRLSTVMNADQILVLYNGEIIERGKHSELAEAKGYYYQLVKNQLELGI
jgi:ABC-type bacteriocin/lantibiotic exporter with double-glycine peptidase domain